MSERSPKVIKYLLDSGYEATIQPLSLYTHEALQNRAKTLFPDPDKADYRLPFPDGVEPAIAGEMRPAEENPEYQSVVRVIEAQRSNWIVDQVLLLTVSFDEDRTKLIQRHKDELEDLRAVGLELPEDAWEATLKHALIRGADEPATLYRVARGTAALTEEDVENGIRLFRVDVSGQAARPVDKPRRAAPDRAENPA